MSTLVYVLLACNVCLPVALVARRCIRVRGVEVDHLFLFTFGFLFYWILPIAVGVARLFEQMPGMSLWFGFFDEVPTTRISEYLLLALLFYVTFAAGSTFAERLFAGLGRTRKILYFDRRLLNLYLIPGVVGSLLLAISLREYLFRGYQGVVYEEVTLRGSMVSASLFLLVLALLYSAHAKQTLEERFWHVVANRFFLAFFAAALVLLLLGGRLYFMTAVFMLLVYRSVYFAPIKPRSFVAFLLIAAVLAAIAGVVRMGGSMEMGTLLAVLGAEPLFTSFSLIEFIRVHDFELIRAPIFLLSGFVNLLPYAIFPWKEQFILNPVDFGYSIFSPMGALNSFVSFMINFGVLGTVIALFLFACVLGCLKATRTWTVSKVLYIMISGWLAFSFFRDPFSISIVKSIFQFSILIPMFVLVSLHVLSSVARVGSRKRGSDSCSTSPGSGPATRNQLNSAVSG